MGNLESLQQKSCKPCEGGTTPFTLSQAQTYLPDLPGWSLDSEGKKIWKNFYMKNFMSAIQFVNQIAELAEKEGHHPDLHLTGYRKLQIELSTHSIGGLSENDFILAGKIEGLLRESKQSAGG